MTANRLVDGRVVTAEWYARQRLAADGRRANDVRLGADRTEARQRLANLREMNRTVRFEPYLVETVTRVTDGEP